jgi:hypothetical protein
MKSSLKFLLALFWSLSTLINIYSQENFQPAYIVNLNNDTIKGLIDIRNWSKTPKTIRFKVTSDANIELYKPIQIRSFGVSKEVYQTAVVTIEISPYRESELTYSDQPENITDTVFLQVLIQGNKSLCCLIDENLKEHFIIFQDSIYKTLFFKKYLKNIAPNKQSGDYSQVQGESGTFIQTINLYRTQLFQYFQDCPSVHNLIPKTKYSRSDLVGLFKKYYAASEKQITYEYKKEKIKSEFGLLAGISLTNAKFSGDDLYAIYRC